MIAVFKDKYTEQLVQIDESIELAMYLINLTSPSDAQKKFNGCEPRDRFLGKPLNKRANDLVWEGVLTRHEKSHSDSHIRDTDKDVFIRDVAAKSVTMSEYLQSQLTV